MLELLDIFRGRTPMPAKLAEAVTASPCLTDAFVAGNALGATPTPANLAALLQLILALLPLILPYL